MKNKNLLNLVGRVNVCACKINKDTNKEYNLTQINENNNLKIQNDMKTKFLQRVLWLLIPLLTLFISPAWATDPVASATVGNNKTFVVAFWTGSKYMALPNNTTASTWAGTEVSVNSSGKVTTENPPTWKMVQDGSSSRYYLTYKNGNNTYYLYKNGTSDSNNNIKGATGDKNYWTFTAGTGGNAGKYQVIAYNRGSYHTCLTYDSNKWKVKGTSGYSIILLEVAPAGPTITPSVTELDWGTVAKGASLTTKTFTITGTNLTSAPLVYSASGGYSVSPSGKAGAAGTLSSQTLTVTPPSTTTPGTYNSTVSISGGGLESAVTVAVKLKVEDVDTFIDEVQSTSGYTSASPHIEQGSYGTTPTLTDKTAKTSGTCEEIHYHFVGWITSTKFEAGTSIADADIQTPTSATGATYYAVWAKQASGSGSATGGITQSEVTSAADGKTAGTYESQSASSASGNWTGTYAFNTQNSKKVMQLNATSGNSIISPTFSGYITNISIVGTNGSSKESRSFYIKNGSTSLATLTFGASTTEGTQSSSITGSYTSFVITASAALYIHSITVTYSSAAYTDYIAKCCDPLGTINGSITLEQSGTSVTVKDWTYTQGSGAAESNIDYYTVNLYASTDSYATAVKTGTCEYNEKSTGVTLTGLTYGVTYKIKIEATGNTGYCPISETLVGSINEVTTETFQLACDVPTNVTASAQTSDGATLSWDDVATNYEYVVDQSSSNPAGSGTAVNGAHSVTLTGLEASTLYYFHVRTNCGNSVYSNWATASFSTTSAAYFPQNKTLWFEAQTESESAWKDGVQCKAWFRDCNDGCGVAPWTYWQANGDSYKKYYAVVIPSTGDYPYVTIQRYNNYQAETYYGIGGAQTYSTGGGSNVIKSTCATDGCLSWSATTLRLYLRGDILVTNGNWESNIGEMIDQNGGVWSYTHSNYAPTATSLDFKLYTNYNFWIGNTTDNNNATLSGLTVGSTYNITATYNVNTHALVMSKTFVKGTVHFDLQDHGSAISDLTNVAANSKISAPTVPTDANYIFGGWYKEPACTNAWDFANDVVTETMTLYAKWYQVTLAVKDEDGTTLSGDGKPTLTRSGASLTATEAGNYVFKDIQLTSGTGTLSSTSSTTPTITSVSSNITVTATFWKPITVTKGTGTGASTFTISATTVARGGSVTVTCAPDASHKNPWTLTITPNDGATYTASASTGSTTISNITKNITVDLSFASKETYTLTFSTKSGYGSPSGGKIDATNLSFNGSGTVTNPLVEGQTLTFPSVSSFAADECSTTFEGWSTNPSCATAPTIKAGDELVLSGDPTTRTYYAVYSQTEEGGGDDFDPSEDVDGDFYITNSDKSYYMSHEKNSNSYFYATAAASKTAATNLFHITKNNDGKFIISFKNSGTTYYVRVYTSSGDHYINITNIAGEATALTISIPADPKNGTYGVGYGSNGRGLMYKNNNGSHRFANQSITSNKGADGYSLLEFEPAASKIYTTNPTCTETFTVTLTGGEGASVDVTGGNVKYNGGTAARFAENASVSISATPSTGYSFSGWTITKEGGGSVTPASSAASTTFTMPADNVTVTATFSPILVSSLKLRAQQTGQSDKTGSDLTMNCYPKEGQTGGNDPLSHTLNVAFYEVLPADALDKTYTWSVRVKASGAADWTNVDFTGNQLNTNAIINYYNNNTGLLKIGTNEGTAEIKITANDASGVSAKVTITVAKVSVTSISVDPTSMNVYAGQKKPVTITFTPLNASDKAYTTGSYSYVTIRSSGSNPFYIEGNATEVVRNETVTVTSDDGSKTATVAVTVNPLPKATFVDIVQNKTDFVGVPSTGILSSTVDEGGLTVTTTKNTPTHADVAKPATGNNCEKEHLHLVGWILKDWADENPDATSAQIAAAGAGYFYAAGSEIDLVAKDGKTFYAVWAKEVTNP